MHEYLVEVAAESSDELMDKYLEGDVIRRRIKKALRQRTIKQ